MRKRIATVLSLAALVQCAAAPTVAAAGRNSPTVIGTLVDGPSERMKAMRATFEQEVAALARGEYEVQFPEDKARVADWTVAGVEANVQRLLSDPEVDIVLSLGFVSSSTLGRMREFPKPVIAVSVADAELQGFPLEKGKSGVHNFSYLAGPAVVQRDLEAFRQLVPFKHVAIVFHAVINEVIPELQERVQSQMRELGIEGHGIPVRETAAEALAALAPEDEAVYVAPLLMLPEQEFDRLVAGLIERKLPSFSMIGRREVEQGILSGVAPEADVVRLARRVALNVLRILRGEDPATFTVTFPQGEQLTINMATARAIEFSPSFALLTEAELLHPLRTESERTLSLEGAVREAVATNLDLKAEEQIVLAAVEDVREARSALRPQVDVQTVASWIDSDRATLAQGSQPERLWTAGATLSQLLWSDEVRANVEIQKRVQRSLEFDRDSLSLDIGRSAAEAYLTVLSALTAERIERENLRLTRSNLDLARVRLSVGSSGPAEVYRWESQIAANRANVINTNAARNQAQIALNQILHRPSEERFTTEETGLDEPSLLTSGGRIFRYMENPWDFSLLRSFAVEVGLERAPELLSLDSLIAAQERVLLAARRSFWSPTAAAQAELSQILVDGGAGSEYQLPQGVETPDDTLWSLGLSATLPLYVGGSRKADRARAEMDLQRLRIQREALAERIEQRIRAAAHEAGASYAGIQLSRDAAASARKNLDLVTDAYSRGAMTILDLLDAQTSSLRAELAAATAVYEFLQDVMEVERATGSLSVLMLPEQREAMFQRLEEYFRKNGRPTK